MLLTLMCDTVQQATDNTSGISCKWLLVGACTPLAAVILALWHALEKSNAGRLEDLKSNYRSVKD